MNGGQTLEQKVEALPLGALRALLIEADAHLVGGWVREAIAGRDPGGDLDVAVQGELEELLDAVGTDFGIEVRDHHRRFGTATVMLADLRVDLTRTRRECYPHPGALPEVVPAGIEEDLARRDFTVNAMALPLSAPGELLDPYSGRDDLEAGTLRVLHDGSFADDPTRAIRAARYGARLDLAPDPATLALLARTRLADVSDSRRDQELARLAAEPTAPRGFALLAEWRVLPISGEVLELIAELDRLASQAPWSGDPAKRSRAILLAAGGGERAEAAIALAGTRPERPSEAVRLAVAHQPSELLLAAAAGGDWIEDYEREWRGVALEIDGEDLMAAGIPEGPAVGAGLRAALDRKIDGGLRGGREEELEAALEVAREAI